MARKCNEVYMMELAHKLDAVEPAARAMLAALKLALPKIDKFAPFSAIVVDDIRAAIAQAEAAGIKE